MLGGYGTEGDVVPSNKFKQSADAQRERRAARAQRASAKATIAALKNQGKGSKARKGK